MINRPLILVVDDEADIRDGVSRWLLAAGYAPHCAVNGQDCLLLTSRMGFHAILLDVLMPVQDGMQTLAALRSDPRTRHVPVVMLSASLRDEQHALDAGAEFFVQKPYDGKKLVSTVQAAVAHHELRRLFDRHRLPQHEEVAK